MPKSQIVRFVAAGDVHGDMADPEALEALYAYCAEYLGPDDLRICLGDAFDFRSLRRGVGAADAESAESLKADIEAGMDFLRRFLRPGSVYLWGNHEHRLDHMIATSGSAIYRDYCQDIKDAINATARKAGARVILPYHAEKGVYRLGPIAMVHGYAHGVQAVHDQAKHYSDRGGALICGHIHRLEQVNTQRHGGGAGFSAGCLCVKEAMAYASSRLATSRWGTGFAAGWVDLKTNQWKIWLVHRISSNPSKWIWQTDLKTWTPSKK